MNHQTPLSRLAVLTFLPSRDALHGLFSRPPNERTRGMIQRIFYFHVPSAWSSFLAFFIVCIASIAFLRLARRSGTASLPARPKSHLFHHPGAADRALWAKPVWNVYWTWMPGCHLPDPLAYFTSLIDGAQYTSDPERRAKFAAVFGISAFRCSIVYMSIRWWRTSIRPVIREGADWPRRWKQALFLLFVPFTVLYITCCCSLFAISTLQQKLSALTQLRG